MSLLSAIGGLVGLAFGGPMGAALGSGIGTLASGGDIGDALKSGLMGYGIGSIPGVAGMAGQAAGAMGMSNLAGQFAAAQGMAQKTAIGQALQGMGSAAGSGVNPAAASSAAAGRAMGGGLGGLLNNPENLLLAGLIQAGEPKPEPLTPLQKRQQETGERIPGYRGTPAPDMRYMNQGGYIQGPGTGKSDSIPAMIYQNGGPVQEARLSDGEFVMTADAVRGAGGGNRNAGAARMYEMMNRFEGMA